MPMWILFLVFLPFPAFGFLSFKFAQELYDSVARKQVSVFRNVLRGRELLSRVFWKYGVIYFPLFYLAASLVFWAGDAIRGRGHFREQSGDSSVETLIFWCLLSLYAIWWSIGIFRCSRNTDNKAWKWLAIVTTGAPIMAVLYGINAYLQIPSEAKALLKCKTDLETYRRENRAFIESEQAKQKLEHPEYYTEEAMALRHKQDEAYLVSCAARSRQIGP
jgi:hypothetical protein